MAGFDLAGCDLWFVNFTFSQLNSLFSWTFSWQDKKMKINGTTIGSETLKQYQSYCNTECWTVEDE